MMRIGLRSLTTRMLINELTRATGSCQVIHCTGEQDEHNHKAITNYNEIAMVYDHDYKHKNYSNKLYCISHIRTDFHSLICKIKNHVDLIAIY